MGDNIILNQNKQIHWILQLHHWITAESTCFVHVYVQKQFLGILSKRFYAEGHLGFWSSHVKTFQIPTLYDIDDSLSYLVYFCVETFYLFGICTRYVDATIITPFQFEKQSQKGHELCAPKTRK